MSTEARSGATSLARTARVLLRIIVSEVLFEETSPSVIVVAHSERTPSDEEFDALFELVDRVVDQYGYAKLLVRAEGSGGPGAHQRKRLARTEWSGRLQIALCTESPTIRGIGTALKWLGLSRIRTFGPHELNLAVRFLGLEEVIAEHTLRRLHQMHQKISGAAA